MNEIKVITELCAEDRARIDRLTEAMERHHNCEGCVQSVINAMQSYQKIAVPVKLDEPATTTEEPKNEPTAPEKVEAPATTQPEEEKPTEAEQTQPEEVKPAVTLEQIQQKVVQLCAGFEGKLKPAVREIINTYGAKVSDLKDQPDKWDEVWGKLTALEAQA